MSVTPTEDDLKAALIALRGENPGLGVPKLHGLLLAGRPNWLVSEKRTRKVLQNEGLTLSSAQKERAGSESLIPVSKVIEGLDISKWSSKVQVRYFGKNKGKGLVAKERISEGEVVWKEDPFILSPEWEIYDLQMSSTTCMYCSTPFSNPAATVPCSAPCPARFCNSLCSSRSARTHHLLCPSKNPASTPLLSFARKYEWMALHALAQCTAKILLDNQNDQGTLGADWEIVRSLAQLGMEERAKGGWLGSAEPDRETWKQAYELFSQAFQSPSTEANKKKLARLLKKPMAEDISAELFNYDAFLRGLGRMSLNLEAHGGLYVLHSHLNHACSPNISIRHLDQRTALSRITVIAKRDIEVGEELFITYVNPNLGLEARRRQILEWGFGTCKCSRCVAEEGDPGREVSAGLSESSDFEKELKAGLGVI